jgi:isopentenyl-diphosphate Delta-isomerase
MDKDVLILVDERDEPAGYEEKEVCHIIPTKLHRAFSIFILNGKGEMLIHRRALSKKTWPGFWTNACCSHPRKGESLEAATQRRLQEEMGFTCPLTHLFAFRYKADYDATYGENEVDHVFVGAYSGEVNPDGEEIAECKFVPIAALLRDVGEHPEKFTPWFKEALPRVVRILGSQ